MFNKSQLKGGIKKILTIYTIFIILPFTLYIVIFVFPQIPNMTLGYQYDYSPSSLNFITDIDVRFSNSAAYIAYRDGDGIHTYRSEDSGYTWSDLMNGSFAYGSRELVMDVYGDTIGILYENYSLSKPYFKYSNNKGLNWSTPGEIPIDFSTFAFINSTYILGRYNNWTAGSTTFNTTIFLSKDVGVNWEFQSMIPNFIHSVPLSDLRVTENQTIYMFGSTSADFQNNSIYRSADLGKTWIEIETNFPKGRLLKGSSNSFYITYKGLDGKLLLFKSTDECITWIQLDISGINHDFTSTITMEIDDSDQIFIVYTKQLPKLTLWERHCDGMDYFWVGHDIWTGRYVSYFFAFFLPAAGIGFLVILAIYSLYTVTKRDNPRKRTKTQVYLK